MSSNLVNVGGVADPHHRYKRPALKVKEENARTNGQRTVIENIDDVCRAIYIPPTYATQFFGYELSVSVRFQEKTKEGGRTCTVLMGLHSAATLERLMTKFELLYVVCPVCKDGGSRLSVSRKNGVRIKCGACGKISPPRQSHKVEKFMTKNPPPKQQSGLEIGSSSGAPSELGAIGSVGGLESVLKAGPVIAEPSPLKEGKQKKKKLESEPESRKRGEKKEPEHKKEHKKEPEFAPESELDQKQASPVEKLHEIF